MLILFENDYLITPHKIFSVKGGNKVLHKPSVVVYIIEDTGKGDVIKFLKNRHEENDPNEIIDFIKSWYSPNKRQAYNLGLL